MFNRQTIAEERSIEGVGLHSGRIIRMRLAPAEAGTGIVFVRRDAGGVEIPATLEHAGPSRYATVIRKGGLEVSTVEHLMAALYALLVDDLRIVLDGGEVPVMDGSSRPFVDMIEGAGRIEHSTPREYMTLVKPIVIERDDKRIAAYPSREFRVTYAIDFEHPQLGYQELSAGLWSAGAFAEKLAAARTFTFEEEVEKLREEGLALGGSLSNAVVVGEKGLLNPGLRFPDEFVRHKMLDLTGDLSLLGRPLRAHVVAYRAGHELHAQLARRIWEARESWYLAPWSEESTNLEAAAQA
jgi:UDP-3-O-[3-hydroxymyristoyl] N-acetylglucosamine deacetylase